MARSFNGTSDAMSVAINLSAYNQVSIAFWLNWTTFGINDALAMEYSVNANSNNGAFFIDPNSSNSSQFDFLWTQAAATKCHFTRPSAGVWHHYVFEIDGTQTGSAAIPVIYVDGVSQSLTFDNSGSGAASLGNYTLYFMSRSASTLFGKGSMADATIWASAGGGGGLLSSSNVTNLINGLRPNKVNSSNLIAWWPLDGYASPETDLSGNGNNLTLTGTAGSLGPPALWRISG